MLYVFCFLPGVETRLIVSPFVQRVAPDVLACIRLAKADTETVTALFNDIRTSFSGSTTVTKGPKRGRTSIG